MSLCPVRRPRQDRTHLRPYGCIGMAPAMSTTKGLPRHPTFLGAHYDGLGTRCVRFAVRIPRSTRRKTCLPVAGQALPGRIHNPQGSSEKFQKCILHLIPLSQAFLAQGHSGFFLAGRLFRIESIIHSQARITGSSSLIPARSVGLCV